MSASWFLVSMYLIWILGSRLLRSNNQSRATLWVLGTCLIVGLLPFMIILITASLSSNTYNKTSWREELTFEGNKINIVQIIDHSLRLLSFLNCVRCWTNFTCVRTQSLPVLCHSDSCFQELRRSDPKNQVRVCGPTSILRPKKCFLILLKCANKAKSRKTQKQIVLYTWVWKRTTNLTTGSSASFRRTGIEQLSRDSFVLSTVRTIEAKCSQTNQSVFGLTIVFHWGPTLFPDVLPLFCSTTSAPCSRPPPQLVYSLSGLAQSQLVVVLPWRFSARPHVCWPVCGVFYSWKSLGHWPIVCLLLPIVCLLLVVILSMVLFSTIRSKTVFGYICQGKHLAVLLHVFFGFRPMRSFATCIISIGVLLTLVRDSQWAQVFRHHLPCILNLLGVLFTLGDPSVSFGASQLVEFSGDIFGRVLHVCGCSTKFQVSTFLGVFNILGGPLPDPSTPRPLLPPRDRPNFRRPPGFAQNDPREPQTRPCPFGPHFFCQEDEHRAAGHAEEHGLLEANHCALWRAGADHTGVHVPLPPISAGGRHLVGLARARWQHQEQEEAAQLVVRHPAASASGGTQTNSWSHKTVRINALRHLHHHRKFGGRSWTKIGTHFVQPPARASREWHGRTCSGDEQGGQLRRKGRIGQWGTPNTEVTRVVTNRTRLKLSAGRRSAKSCGVRTLRARPFPSRNLCGKWKRGKTRTPRLEGAEADFMWVSACVVSERLAPSGHFHQKPLSSKSNFIKIHLAHFGWSDVGVTPWT